MKLPRQFLRSIEGQLALLAMIYLGAALLALAALALRTVLFEPYIREKYLPPPTDLKTVLAELAQGSVPMEEFEKTVERLARLQAKSENALPAAREQLLQAAYGAWMDDAELDPQGRLAKCFFSVKGRLTIERIRLTLVAGDERQRGRVVVLLRWAVGSEVQSEAGQLCEFARRRAERRHESALVQQANETLAVLAGGVIPGE